MDTDRVYTRRLRRLKWATRVLIALCLLALQVYLYFVRSVPLVGSLTGWLGGVVVVLALVETGFLVVENMQSNLVREIAERRRTEDALRASEERYRGLFDRIPVGLYRTAPDGEILNANPALADMLGYPDTESLLASSAAELYVNSAAREKEQVLLEQGETVRDFETQLRRLDGRIIWVKDSARSVLAADGRVAYYEGSLEDVTERKQVEDALRALSSRYEAMLAAVPDMIMEVDSDKIYTWANQAGQDFFGDDVLGKEASLYFEGEQSTYDVVQPIFDGDETVTYVESWQRRKDGAVRLLGWWCRVLKDADGNLLGALSSARDITEQRQAETSRKEYSGQLEEMVRERTAELQLQYARLGAILDSTTDGIIVAGAGGEILQTNPVARAWITQSLSPEDASLLRETVYDLVERAEGKPQAVLELTGMDLELTASPISEPGSEAAAVIAIHDVSHLKALDRMKTHFVSSVSHELRTPVTTILLYVKLMQQNPDRWDEYLDTLMWEAKHQARLVEDIMEISRIDAGRLELKTQVLSINDLVEEITYNRQVLAQESGLVLEYRPFERALETVADRRRVVQVLDKLVENAVRYTPEGGNVIVLTGEEVVEGRVWATVTVKDSGIGIPEEDLPHIFERFFRGHGEEQIENSGTGLGLAIVREIVELHGGRVTVESAAGMGTIFTVWLPAAGGEV